MSKKLSWELPAENQKLAVKIKGMMLEQLYKSPIRDVSDLKQCLIKDWLAVQQHIIDEATDDCRKHFANACTVAFQFLASHSCVLNTSYDILLWKHCFC